MKRTLIHNATIVNEGQSVQGSVVIENGRIAEVLTNWKPLSAPCEEVIDATGCYLLPGIIDDHVHFRDPGLTHKADILTESRAAAAGGVTSIMDMPNTNPLTVTLDALNAKLDLLNEKCIVNHSCYFGATNNNYTEFDKLDKHRVCGIKLFMGSSTGNMLVDKMNSLLNIFNGTDTGVGTDGNVIRSFIFLLVFLDIVFYCFLIFAMGGNQHIRTVEYIQQAVHFIHQHITGTGAHEQQYFRRSRVRSYPAEMEQPVP